MAKKKFKIFDEKVVLDQMRQENERMRTLMNIQAEAGSKDGETTSDKAPDAGLEIKYDPAPVTGIFLCKQYLTYPALMRIRPVGEHEEGDCFAKVVLYVMNWFLERLTKPMGTIPPEVEEYRKMYPTVENYREFSWDALKDIREVQFLDMELLCYKEEYLWSMTFMEPDNGLEGKFVQGRFFKTEIAVRKEGDTAVLGLRQSCREPSGIMEDAKVIRPGLIRALYLDETLSLGEYGLQPEYDFAENPVFLNGKSASECQKIYDELLASEHRQLPVLLVPEAIYTEQQATIQRATMSLLGFGHVVVWKDSCQKLFRNTMDMEQCIEPAEACKLLILYKDFHTEDGVEVCELQKKYLDIIKNHCLRMDFDYGEFEFRPKAELVNLQDLIKENGNEIILTREEYETLQDEIASFEESYSAVQMENNDKKAQIKKLEGENHTLFSTQKRYEEERDRARAEMEEAKRESAQCKAEAERLQKQIGGMIEAEKERSRALMAMPKGGLDWDSKKEILDWIEKYYSQWIEVLPAAVKAFKSNNNAIDWHRFCLYIHYLSGYTKHRNAGGRPEDESGLRMYDPEDMAIRIDQTDRGQGATEFYEEDYTIEVDEGNGPEKKIMDKHIKYGKGRGDNPIRIYFYYSEVNKKSYIGYMPGHLATRKDAH